LLRWLSRRRCGDFAIGNLGLTETRLEKSEATADGNGIRPSARRGVRGPPALPRRPQPDWNQLRDGLSRAPAWATTAHISVAAQTLTVTGIFAERKQLAVLILLYKHKISLLNY